MSRLSINHVASGAVSTSSSIVRGTRPSNEDVVRLELLSEMRSWMRASPSGLVEYLPHLESASLIRTSQSPGLRLSSPSLHESRCRFPDRPCSPNVPPVRIRSISFGSLGTLSSAPVVSSCLFATGCAGALVILGSLPNGTFQRNFERGRQGCPAS